MGESAAFIIISCCYMINIMTDLIKLTIMKIYLDNIAASLLPTLISLLVLILITNYFLYDENAI